MVTKKDGSVRFCIDYRRVNEVTRKDSYPLPRISEVLDVLQGVKYFSTIDFASGYCTITYGFNTEHFILQPNYVHLQPQLITTCTTFGQTFSNTNQLDWITLGYDCNSELDCNTCTKTSGCGWCFTKNTCISKSPLHDVPYCDECENYVLDDDQCINNMGINCKLFMFLLYYYFIL
jgi:hypothetical protein